MVERQKTPRTHKLLNAFRPEIGQRILALEQSHGQSILGQEQMKRVADEKAEYEILKDKLGSWYGLARILAHTVQSLRQQPEEYVEPQAGATMFFPTTGLTIRYDSIENAASGRGGKVVLPKQ